jgi:hypothetical protein
MKTRQILLAALLLIAIACRQTQPELTGAEMLEGKPSLVVRLPNFQLLESAGEKARPICPLPPGTRVYSLGEASGFTTRLQIAGQVYEEPWLLVEMENGAQGWVYAAAFANAEMKTGNSEAIPLHLRLEALLGSALKAQLTAYLEGFESIRSAEDLARNLENGHRLRDSITTVLDQKGVSCQSLLWLKEAIPTMAPHLGREAKSCHLFLDYRSYLAKTPAMPGKKGRQFMEIYLVAFPEDSIEYFFPSWVIQDGLGQQHSLLGKGIHYQMLEKLEALSSNEGFPQGELQRLRKALLNDILDHSVTFWETQEKAAAELERILEKDFNLLDKRDKIALRARLQHFENPEQNRIQFGHRSGIYQLE